MTDAKYLNAVLTTIAVLLALNLWVGINTAPGVGLDNEAIAQGRIDAGQQRAEMITQLKELKSSVDSMSKKLTDGSVTVKVEGDSDND